VSAAAAVGCQHAARLAGVVASTHLARRHHQIGRRTDHRHHGTAPSTVGIDSSRAAPRRAREGLPANPSCRTRHRRTYIYIYIYIYIRRWPTESRLTGGRMDGRAAPSSLRTQSTSGGRSDADCSSKPARPLVATAVARRRDLIGASSIHGIPCVQRQTRATPAERRAAYTSNHYRPPGAANHRIPYSQLVSVARSLARFPAPHAPRTSLPSSVRPARRPLVFVLVLIVVGGLRLYEARY